MSTNFQIIMLFLSDFYRNRRGELAEIISPDFRYRSPFFDEVGFEDYVNWMSRLSAQRSIAKVTIPTSDDDEVFTHTFLLKALDFTDEFAEEILGQTQITIKDGLIERVENIYEDELLNPEKFERIKAKLIRSI